jgi:hypothetical protein
MAMPAQPPQREPIDGPEPESPGLISFGEPTAVFMRGTPNADAQRLAETILDLRPGLLFIVTAD